MSERKREAARQNLIKLNKSPEHRARMAVIARRNATLLSPKAHENRWGIEARRKRWATRMPGIPYEYKDEYRVLTKSKKLTPAEARMVIEEDIARKASAELKRAEAERQRKATIDPFQRQLERVKAGARVIAKPAMPRRGYDYTLGGVSAI